MWSKHAEANQNMTSLKSKISQKKQRKNSNNANSNNKLAEQPVVTSSEKSKKNKKQNKKTNKEKAPDLIEDLKQDNKQQQQRVSDDNKEAENVILRKTADNNVSVSTTKRYSDSFVVFGNTDLSHHRKIIDEEKPRGAPVVELTRAKSTLLVTNTEPCDFILSSTNNKSDKKHRRFSDLFRHSSSNLKASSSCENLKAKMLKEFEASTNEFNGVNLRPKQEKSCKDQKSPMPNSTTKRANSSTKIEPTFKKPQSTQPEKKKSEIKPTVVVAKESESYLKRVKSKIYKQKSDSHASSLINTMPNIAENENNNSKKSKSKGKDKDKDKDKNKDVVEVRRSIPHFDFRLIRQTSNLERIRPKSFGLSKKSVSSASNVGIFDSDLVDSSSSSGLISVDKNKPSPLLSKSKSSSAINLNLLRSRRSKLQDGGGASKKNSSSTNVQDEFEFIAFGDVSLRNSKFGGSSQSIANGFFANNNCNSNFGNNHRLNNNNWIIHDEEGEQKPGHPVTRTGSDRRPDAVREESINKGAGGGNQENQNASPERSEENVNSTVSLPASAGHKRGSSNITRSESVKQQSEKQRNKRRNISDPLHNQTPQNEIVDLSQEGSQELSHTDSSASNSSLSSRSSDSPSTSIDAVANLQHGTPSSVWDSDMEVEADPPDWQSTLTEEEINRLHPHEKKRQDVINELFHTERTHVRNLKVLRHVFLERISSSKVLKPDEIKLVFSNVKDVLEMHTEFNKTMKSKRREERPVINSVGDILLNMFDGCQGDAFKKAAATFCERQQLALEFIKERRKKDSRFESILKDCETNKECRRLPLQGIITTEMQRLSKYPLLIERVIDHVQKLSKNNPDFNEELNKLKQAHTRSKEILNHVNDAAKQALNQARLEEIQKHLDTTQFDRNDHLIVQEFRNLDLTRYKLLHEGSICLNRPNKAPLPVHLLVLEEAVIILQREGEKYLLKFFHTGGSQSSAPILKMANVLVRPNAAEKDCLFLLNSYTASVQMYDLKAKDPADMRR